MHKIFKTALSATALASAMAIAAPALAQDEAPALRVTGSATLTSEYRLRGISQTDNDPAVQASITLTTAPGFYVGAWASNLAGNGSWGGSNMELDLLGGYTTAVGGATVDGGVIYYVYPGTKGHDFLEVYGSVSGALGPVNAKVGTFWAPPQKNIAISPSKGNNIWVYGEVGVPFPSTPITLKGHVGYSSGDSIYTWGKDVVDYSVGADFTYDKLTLNVSYVGTDLPKAFANANFGAGSKPGHSITRGMVMATLTAAF